jgi:hypothetical protein
MRLSISANPMPPATRTPSTTGSIVKCSVSGRAGNVMFSPARAAGGSTNSSERDRAVARPALRVDMPIAFARAVPRRHRTASGELPSPRAVRVRADLGLFEPGADPAPTKGWPAVFSHRPRGVSSRSRPNSSRRAVNPSELFPGVKRGPRNWRNPRFPRTKSWLCVAWCNATPLTGNNIPA